MNRLIVLFAMLIVTEISVAPVSKAADNQLLGTAATQSASIRQPRLSHEDASRLAIDSLQHSEAEFRRVSKIPADFPDEHWWPEVIRTYVDADNGRGALEFAKRWHKTFGQSCGREALRIIASRLSARGQFGTAKKVALILVEQNNPMLYGYSPHANEDLCAGTLALIAGRQAASGDFAGAVTTANMIPRKRRAFARANAFHQIALAYARSGDAQGVRRQSVEYKRIKSLDSHETTLLFVVELAMAGAIDDAAQWADTLPASARRAARTRIALAQALSGDWAGSMKTTAGISKINERHLTLLQLAAIKAGSGDPDGAFSSVDDQIGADQISHPFRSQYFVCRDTLGRAIAWSGNFAAAEKLTNQKIVEPIQRRLQLGRILDYSAAEKSITVSNQWTCDPAFAYPTKLTRLGTSAFHDAERDILPLLNLVSRGENVSALAGQIGHSVQQTHPDDFSYQSSMYSLLGAACSLADEKDLAIEFCSKSIDAADERDFRERENIPCLLGTLVCLGKSDAALKYFQRVVHVKRDDRRFLSTLAAQLAFAMAQSDATSHLERLRRIVPRQSDRALVCLGAAQGFLAAATYPVNKPVPRDAYEMLIRCNLALPLPQVRNLAMSNFHPDVRRTGGTSRSK